MGITQRCKKITELVHRPVYNGHCRQVVLCRILVTCVVLCQIVEAYSWYGILLVLQVGAVAYNGMYVCNQMYIPSTCLQQQTRWQTPSCIHLPLETYQSCLPHACNSICLFSCTVAIPSQMLAGSHAFCFDGTSVLLHTGMLGNVLYILLSVCMRPV